MTAHADSRIKARHSGGLNVWRGGWWAELRMAALVPSPNQQTAKMNIPAIFKRVIRAAGGRRRLRRFIRKMWAAKPCRKAFLITMHKVFKWVSVQGLICDVWRAANSGDPAVSRASNVGVLAKLMVQPMEKREARRFVERERFEERLRDIAPAWADEDNPDGIDGEELAVIHMYAHFVCLPESEDKNFKIVMRKLWKLKLIDGGIFRAIKYATVRRDKKAVLALIEKVKSFRASLTALLKHLEAEAYRAHLAKRVKPVSRRTRVRRPLYARPRPPSCPLAPPVI